MASNIYKFQRSSTYWPMPDCGGEMKYSKIITAAMNVQIFQRRSTAVHTARISRSTPKTLETRTSAGAYENTMVDARQSAAHLWPKLTVCEFSVTERWVHTNQSASDTAGMK